MGMLSHVAADGKFWIYRTFDVLYLPQMEITYAWFISIYLCCQILS